MKIMVFVAALVLGGCASSREASPPVAPHQAPVQGARYSRIIYVQKSHDGTFVPPAPGVPVKPKPVIPVPSTGSDVPTEEGDCANGHCTVPHVK
jgi:hypothetical protein